MARPASIAKAKASAAAANPTVYPNNLVEASTFFAGPVPLEVKTSVELFHTTSAETVERLLQIVSQYLASDYNDFALESSVYENFATPAIANALLTGVYCILKVAVRNKAKVSVIKKDLLAMHLPLPVANLFCEQIVRTRTPLERVMVQSKRIHLPKVEKLRWRIDVAISSGSLSRVMRPNILMQIVTQDGHVSTFEVSLELFSQLRYNVAKVLNEMNATERHPIMRIVNEFRRREEEDYNN